MAGARAVVRAGAANAAILALTSLHHWYGAVRFDTPWRTHVVHLAVWAGLVMGALLSAGWALRGRPLGRLALVLFTGCSAVVALAWLGLYEGAYNHVLKNAVHAVSGAGEVFQRMFPPPLYEQPVDWLFELSGIAQLPCGWVATRNAMRLVRPSHTNAG